MKRIDLTEEEKAHLESLHYETTDRKSGDRIKAVLLRSEGWTVPQIAQALRLHQTTVTRHLNDYRAGQLSARNGGSSSKLNPEETELLIDYLSEHTYHHTHEIAFYIRETYGKSYSISGLNKWLHHHGFSYKKPKGKPYKAEESKQIAFIEKYNGLKKDLKPREKIIFMDAVHPSQKTKLSYGWIKKGTDKHIKTTASRTRMNLLGAIELGQLAQTVTKSYETINSASIIDFFKTLRASKKYSSTLHVILDGSGYHRAESVQMAAKKYRIQLHYLPPYSPNLNPIERLWKVMHEKVRNNRFFQSSQDFKQNIEEFFDKILPDIADSLNSRINDNFQIFKHAT